MRFFSEGYYSPHPESLIRRQLCTEAIRLCAVLLDNSICDQPSARALMALMLLHGARLDARIDQSGAIVLLREQDRSRWDHDAIGAGLRYLSASAKGDVASRYHLEAGIAARHCVAPDFDKTDWRAILADYDRLLLLAPDPLHAFNRCIALAEVDGPRAALAALEVVESNWQLSEQYYLFDVARGEFLARLGQKAAAMEKFGRAYRKTCSRQEQRLLEKKIAGLGS